MINYNFNIDINPDLKEKLLKLKDIIKDNKSAVIAFSGGVDSTFLATVSFQVLKEKCIAVTNFSSLMPEREFYEAKKLAKLIGIKFDSIQIEEVNNPLFTKNPVNRCYFCKKNLYEKLLQYAKENNYNSVFDGSNISDDMDYRPGQLALKELKIVSPLKMANLTKEDIRILSGFYNLPTKDKPSLACLASRIPYNDEITKDKIKIVEKSEDFLYSLGFKNTRVRLHNNIARIEIDKKQFFDIIENKDRIIDYFKKLGIVYITLDLEGYRTGSMNIF